jgi:3-oxoadipate enol-lactonase
MPFLERPGGIRLHYELDDFTDPWRAAPVLILQHGNGRSGRFWYRWVPYLSRFFRVVRPDMRGLGQSSKLADPARDLTLQALLDDLAALVGHLGGGTVHFCGESMGGILGLVLAATHPELVRTLTLVATPVYISDAMKTRYALGHASRPEAMVAMGMRPWVEATTRMTRLPEDSDPALFKWYVDEFLTGDAELQVMLSKLVNAANVSEVLAKVQAPVLGLYPTSGQITSPEQEAMLREKLARFKMIHLPTEYHMVQLMFPATCARHVLEFCAGHDGFSPDEA